MKNSFINQFYLQKKETGENLAEEINDVVTQIEEKQNVPCISGIADTCAKEKSGLKKYKEKYREWFLEIECVNHGLSLLGKDVTKVNKHLQFFEIKTIIISQILRSKYECKEKLKELSPKLKVLKICTTRWGQLIEILLE